MNLLPGDRIKITELGCELDYRIIRIDSNGIHVHSIVDPYHHYLLVLNLNNPIQKEYILYRKLNPVKVSLSTHQLIPAYNPEADPLHPEQDYPV